MFSKIVGVFTLSLFSFFAQAEEFLMPDKVNVLRLKVIRMIPVREGDSCIKLTQLTLKECISLGRRYGRDPVVYIAPDGNKTWYVPLYAGEQLALVQVKEGESIHLAFILKRKQ